MPLPCVCNTCGGECGTPAFVPVVGNLTPLLSEPFCSLECFYKKYPKEETQ